MKTNQLKIGDVVIIPTRGDYNKYLYVGMNSYDEQLFCSIRRPQQQSQIKHSTINSYLDGYLYRSFLNIPQEYKGFYCKGVFKKYNRTFHFCKLLYNISPRPKRRKTKKTIST